MQSAAIAKVLCKGSRAHAIDPYKDLVDQFPERLDMDQWFMPPELISLHGTPVFEAMSEAERMRLSFYETVSLFSFTLHGEQVQVEGLAKRLYKKELTDVTAYLHHFLDEENNHMAFFGAFCLKYAGKVYPAVYPSMGMSREYEPGEEDFLFFVKLMIFEELGDAYNVAIAADERVAPIVRDINQRHHQDEARHLTFGRAVVKELFDHFSPSWSEQTLAGVRKLLQDYLAASWWEFYSPRAYRDAGVAGDAFDTREQAFEHPACQAHRKAMSAKVVNYLLDTGILLTEPELV
jgi:hypothetical protein